MTRTTAFRAVRASVTLLTTRGVRVRGSLGVRPSRHGNAQSGVPGDCRRASRKQHARKLTGYRDARVQAELDALVREVEFDRTFGEAVACRPVVV